MPNRQWFCWNLCLKYSCGCSNTSSQHVCNEDRGVKCHSWTAVRVTVRTCGKHRDLDGCLPAAEAAEEDGEHEVGDWWVDGGGGSGDGLVRVVGSEGVGAAGLERGRRVVGGGGEPGDGLERGARRRGGGA